MNMRFLARRKLQVADIDDIARLRPVDPTWVGALAEMMAADGQQTPLLVRQEGGGDDTTLTLIAGGHRLAAGQGLRQDGRRRHRCPDRDRQFFAQAWPEDWPVILAAIGGHYHWSRTDLLALTAQEAAFWHSAAAELWKRTKRET